jgi:malate dehydrogenase (oxaloacetate-decarboxylating)(NADP+)
VNNVLCFPFIFRGALDAGATTITEQMKLAAVRAIAELAQAEVSDIVATRPMATRPRWPSAPSTSSPSPFDPRLIVKIAPAVAQAAMDSGVATRPVRDFAAYRQQLTQFVFHSGTLMKPVFTAAQKAPKRVLYCEGEDERVLRAIQAVVDEGIARPVALGRPKVIEARLQKARPAHRDRTAISNWSTSATTRATAILPRSTTASCSATASRRPSPSARCCARTH